MEYGKDKYLSVNHLKNDREGKAPNQHPAKALVDLGIHQGLSNQSLDGRLDTSEELLSKAGSAPLVPIVSLGHVLLCFWGKY